MIVSTKELFKHAYGKYAVGAYNINNAGGVIGEGMDSEGKEILGQVLAHRRVCGADGRLWGVEVVEHGDRDGGAELALGDGDGAGKRLIVGVGTRRRGAASKNAASTR